MQRGYTLDRRSVERLGNMLRSYERRTHRADNMRRSGFLPTEPPRPQWLLQPIVKKAASGEAEEGGSSTADWMVRVWGGWISKGATQIFWPSSVLRAAANEEGDQVTSEQKKEMQRLYETAYKDIELNDLQAGETGYIIWQDDSAETHDMEGTVRAVKAETLETDFPYSYSILGTVYKDEDGKGIGVHQWAFSTILRAAGMPWELSISGRTATCTNCMAMISAITLFADRKEVGSDKPSNFESLSVALTGSGGWICGTFNSETKKLGLIYGLPAYATSFHENEETIVFPLYYVESDSNDNWSVVVDARAMPRVGVYW